MIVSGRVVACPDVPIIRAVWGGPAGAGPLHRRDVRAGQGCTTVQANPTRERTLGEKGIPVSVSVAKSAAETSGTIDGAERLAGHSEVCHFLHVIRFVSLKGVTLMLKVNLLASVAYFFAGLFSKSEGQTWS